MMLVITIQGPLWLFFQPPLAAHSARVFSTLSYSCHN